MTTAKVNGVRLYCRLSGGGPVSVVLVHGSWVDHRSWDRVVPRLAESLRVLTYDRRGHSRSERPAGQGSVREDVADLAALIGHFELAPAWVVGNSFGAAIALRLAAARPELLRGLVGHEPPLFSLLAGHPTAEPMLEPLGRRLGGVVERIASGDHAGGAEEFVEKVALGEGVWAQLPPGSRRTFIENAPTFLDEARDPEQIVFDVESVRGFAKPALLTMGDRSPPVFRPVVERIAAVLPNVEVATFAGAGHIPQSTHPDAWVEMVTGFIQRHAD